MARLEVPQGEHVSYVVGNAGWYVDNLVFISSSGRPLGRTKGRRRRRLNFLSQDLLVEVTEDHLETRCALWTDGAMCRWSTWTAWLERR